MVYKTVKEANKGIRWESKGKAKAVSFLLVSFEESNCV